MKLWPQFLRVPYFGRKEITDAQIEAEGIVRAGYSDELLSNQAFIDAHNCELDLLLDAMLDADTDTRKGQRRLIALQRRAQELQSLMKHLQAFAGRGRLLKIKQEKEDAKKEREAA